MTEEIKKVGPVDPDKHTSEIIPADEAEKDRMVCYYNGEEFSPGMYICSANRLLKCGGNGMWINYGKNC